MLSLNLRWFQRELALKSNAPRADSSGFGRASWEPLRSGSLLFLAHAGVPKCLLPCGASCLRLWLLKVHA